MPALLDQWRKVRAQVAHDWLERGLLPVLNTQGETSAALSSRAKVCLEDWNQEIVPRLEVMLSLLPDCLLPGLLLREHLTEEDIERVERAALDRTVNENLLFGNVADKIRAATAEAAMALEAYCSSPNDSSRLKAFTSVLALRIAIQEAPKSVVLP